MIDLKPCPFCGFKPDYEDPDTLYPNAVGWKLNTDGSKMYYPFHEVPPEQWCYSLHCVATAGGCGAQVEGDSKEECITLWNTRVNGS